MSKKFPVAFLFLAFVLGACQSEPRYFLGESDHWEGELHATEGEEDDEQVEFILNYKGTNHEAVSSVNYEVDGVSFGITMRDGKLGEEGKLRLDKSIEVDMDKKNKIICTVEWNGKTEKFTLNQS